MRLLVTGAAGFIGSNYVCGLLSGALTAPPDIRVTVLDKLTYAGNLANLDPVTGDPRLTFVEGDIADDDLLARLVPGHDAIVNFAAESHVDRSIAGSQDFVHANVVGTHALLQAALDARVERFVQVSTDEVYGSIAEGSWSEDSPVRPNSPYAATKAAADMLACAFARTHGLNVSITRCGNNYGPRQYPEKLIPLFITHLLEGRPVPLYGDGGNIRHWIHVEDHCRAVQLVLHKGEPGAVYNVGGGRELTNMSIAGQLIEACGSPADSIRHVPDRPGHDYRYSLDGGKLRDLGFTPRIGFEEGLAATVRWYRENRSWWEPLKDIATKVAENRP
ncbi:dTDP-glucose 4,6-dehydratase [Streptomyces sp. NPDC059544]|uniref:dTDP-glucose 4,6-dehydratase n=1 Tax=Streptomyces sp. NPDC059544 TaxID=3346861 RepID=UPI003673DF39